MAGLWTLHVWLYLPVTLSCFISCCLFIRFLGIGKSFTFYFIFTIVYIFERVHIHVGLWFSGEGWGMEEGGWDNYFSSFFLPMSLEREVREGVPVPCCQATSSRGDMTILCHLRDPSEYSEGAVWEVLVSETLSALLHQSCENLSRVNWLTRSTSAYPYNLDICCKIWPGELFSLFCFHLFMMYLTSSIGLDELAIVSFTHIWVCFVMHGQQQLRRLCPDTCTPTSDHLSCNFPRGFWVQ